MSVDVPSPGEWYARWRPHVCVGDIPVLPTSDVPHGSIIDCDVPRTKITECWDVDTALLAHILKAYACSPMAVPYTQGMSFIAALALWVSYGKSGTADMSFAYHLYRRMLAILGDDFFYSLVPTAFPQQNAEVPLLGLRTCVDTMRTMAASLFRSRNLFPASGQREEESAVLCVDFAACSWLPKGMVQVGPLMLTLETWDRALLFGNISALAVVTIALITLALEQRPAHEDDDDGIGTMLNCVKEAAKHADTELRRKTLALADAMVDEWSSMWSHSRKTVSPEIIRNATEKQEMWLIQEAWPELRREDLDRIRVNFAKDAEISPRTFVTRLRARGWSPQIAARLKNYLWPTIDDNDECMSYAELVVALSRWANFRLCDKLRWIFDSFVRDYGVCEGVPLERLMEVHRVIFGRDEAEESLAGYVRPRSCVSDPGDDAHTFFRSSTACASIAGVGLETEDRVEKFFRRLQLMSSLHYGCSTLSPRASGVSFQMWYIAIVSDRVLCAALQSSLMPPSRPLLFEADDDDESPERCRCSCRHIKHSCSGTLRAAGQRFRRWWTMPVRGVSDRQLLRE